MSTKHILINGDSRHMSLIPKESVHLIVTSPPYWQLKDYGNNRQIGFNDTYRAKIRSLADFVSPQEFVLLEGKRHKKN